MSKGMRIRTDDQVVITGGKDRGKTGRVVRTDPKKRVVFVENHNMVKRHQRPRSVKDAQKGGEVGGIIEKEGPIHVSNVMLLDPQNNVPTRIRIERGSDGKRKRISAKSGQEID
jgi:large subunit ribosomal protein L24